MKVYDNANYLCTIGTSDKGLPAKDTLLDPIAVIRF